MLLRLVGKNYQAEINRNCLNTRHMNRWRCCHIRMFLQGRNSVLPGLHP
jgi:hypothetical protein